MTNPQSILAKHLTCNNFYVKIDNVSHTCQNYLHHIKIEISFRKPMEILKMALKWANMSIVHN